MQTQTINLTSQQAAALLGPQQFPSPLIQTTTKAKKVFGVLSLFLTFIVIVFFWIATGLGEKDFPETFGIMIVPSAWILLPAMLVLTSVFRLQTNYGFTVSIIVFSSLNAIAGIGLLISFSLLASTCYDESDDYYSYYYGSYYYGENYGNYETYYYGRLPDYNEDLCTSYTFAAFGGGILLLSQIFLITLASFEIKRIPKQKQVFILSGDNPGMIQMPAYTSQPYLMQAIFPPQSVNEFYPATQMNPISPVHLTSAK